MAGYRDNQWYLPEGVEGVTGVGGLVPTSRDNEPFLYPGVSKFQTKLGIGAQTNTNNNRQTKGFIRSLNRIAGVTNADRRFFFQFNPPALMRNLAMNTDMLNPLLLTPGELTLPVPGQANFSFEIMLDRQMEVNLGPDYSETARNIDDLTSDRASAYDIGVLADINVLDKVIGVGIDPEAVEVALKRAEIQFANQASDADGTSTTSNITKITVLPQDEGKFPVKFEHATVDFLTEGQTVDIGGFVPISFNLSGAEVTNVSNTTPFSFVINYSTSPADVGASATTLGSVSKPDAEDTGDGATPTEGFDLEQVRTRLTSLGAESNRAFLIPNPVRVVFSSLYMVDGYVTGVNLLFTKFSRNMVPVTATLSIQMEARYIGFAREKTFLTQILEQANAPSITTPIAPPVSTPVNEKYGALVAAVQSILNDYEILLCGTDIDDNPTDWCKPIDENYVIRNVLSFDEIVVQFGFRTAYNLYKEDIKPDGAIEYNNKFAKYIAQGNIRSMTHQIDSLEVFRKVVDPSEPDIVTILEVGPVTAPTITSYDDFKRHGALGGSKAPKNSSVTNVENTILKLSKQNRSSEQAKDLARRLYFQNAVPDGLDYGDVPLFANIKASLTVEDNDGNTVLARISVADLSLGNLNNHLYVKVAFRLSLPQEGDTGRVTTPYPPGFNPNN